MLSRVTAGSAGTLSGSPGLSVFQRGEKVLMKATISARCCLVRAFHAGMLELLNPRPKESSRSSSVGRVPLGVGRHLNVAATKFRGKIFRYGSFSPLTST